MMTPLSGSTILIGQSSLFDIAGSEVVTFELATHFAERGAEVIVVAFGVSDEWRERFQAIPGTSVRRYDDPELGADLIAKRPDIAWIHHGVIPEALLHDPGETRFVFHHMSAYQFQEFPHSPRVEAALASAIVFPAQETLDAHLASGLYADVDESLLSVFGNPAPDAFARGESGSERRLNRLLMVSNHPPAELEEALELLGDRGIEIVRFGGSATDPAPKRLVAAGDIAGVDAVVSIGKTVQYSLVAGVPVYVYDHFGGPGWLTEDAFEHARYANFSGRGFSRREGSAIAAEIQDGFASAGATAQELRERHGGQFLLSTAVDRVLSGMPAALPKGGIDAVELAAATLRGELLNGLVNAAEACTLTVKDLTTRLSLSQRENEALVAEVASQEAAIAHLSRTPGLKTARRLFDAASRAKHRILRR